MKFVVGDPVAEERERWVSLLAELRHLAGRCEWPDGDGAQVIAQMWAEEWVRKLDGPNAELTGARDEGPKRENQ